MQKFIVMAFIHTRRYVGLHMNEDEKNPFLVLLLIGTTLIGMRDL